MDRFNQLTHLEDRLGIEETLESLVKAMSNQDFNELYQYICTCWDIEEELA